MVYAILIVVAATAAIIAAFLIVGVRVQGYFDLASGIFVVDVFAIANIHMLRYRVFECGGDFYSQTNSKDLKKVKMSANNGESGEKSGESDKNAEVKTGIADKIATVCDVLAGVGKIKLKKLRAYLTVGTGDSMSTSLVAATIGAALSTLNAATYDRIRVKEGDIAVYPNFRYENTVFTFDIETGAGLAGIIFESLKARSVLTSLATKRKA